MAAQYSYLLVNALLLDTVTALVPQHVCMQGRQRRYAPMASLWRYVWGCERQGCALPVWQPRQHLVIDGLFLLSSVNPKSFSSRHFGPVSVSAVIVRRSSCDRTHVDDLSIVASI